MKGIARILCFIGTAFLSAAWSSGALPMWDAVIAGGIIGICAGYGWKD